MTELSVGLSGLDDLDDSIAAVIQALTDPQTAARAAALIAASARPLVPVDTGELAASERVGQSGTGAQLVYAARHAPIVHARAPWLGEAITAAVPELEQLYARQATDAWG